MDITSLNSPNFDERTLPISLLVLHYTGMESGAVAIERLCNPEAKVSAHYVIAEDGKILSLVAETHRAWHAGVSQWQGETNVNSASIGIEIVNGGHDFPDETGDLPPFPQAQINAVIFLCKDIISRRGPLSLLGHSDVAPLRKVDPGEHFPWEVLAATGLGFWPRLERQDERVLFEAESRDRGVAIVQRGLAHIGYGAHVTGVMDENTQAIIKAVQRRYRPRKIDGVVDIDTMEIIKLLAETASSLSLA